jgi:Fe-S cluster biogenesis protein NfuA
MADAAANGEVRHRMERLESLLREVENIADPHVKACTREIMQSVLDLHGTALERMFHHIASSQDSGQALIDALAGDNLVSSLLLLHGLHPLDLPARVRQALDKVRPSLLLEGGNVELLEIAGGAVRVTVKGSCHGSSAKKAIEDAVYELAPDVQAIEFEDGANGKPVEDRQSRIALPLVYG